MKTRNLIILAAVAAAVVCSAWAWTSRGAAVSDEVMTANALQYVVDTEPTAMLTEASTGAPDDYPIVPWASPDELKAAYPECCRFADRATDGYKPPFLYRLTRNYAGIVTVQAGWKVEYPDGVKTVDFLEPLEVTMNRNGEPVDTLPLK